MPNKSDAQVMLTIHTREWRVTVNEEGPDVADCLAKAVERASKISDHAHLTAIEE